MERRRKSLTQPKAPLLFLRPQGDFRASALAERKMNSTTTTSTELPDPCSSTPCLHGGSCSPHTATQFVCACTRLYSGLRCEDDLAMILAGLGGGLGCLCLILLLLVIACSCHFFASRKRRPGKRRRVGDASSRSWSLSDFRQRRQRQLDPDLPPQASGDFQSYPTRPMLMCKVSELGTFGRSASFKFYESDGGSSHGVPGDHDATHH